MTSPAQDAGSPALPSLPFPTSHPSSACWDHRTPHFTISFTCNPNSHTPLLFHHQCLEKPTPGQTQLIVFLVLEKQPTMAAESLPGADWAPQSHSPRFPWNLQPLPLFSVGCSWGPLGIFNSKKLPRELTLPDDIRSSHCLPPPGCPSPLLWMKTWSPSPPSTILEAPFRLPPKANASS